MIPTFDRYQLYTGYDEEGEPICYIMDLAFGVTVARGTDEEMIEYLEKREQEDMMSLWKS